MKKTCRWHVFSEEQRDGHRCSATVVEPSACAARGRVLLSPPRKIPKPCGFRDISFYGDFEFVSNVLVTSTLSISNRNGHFTLPLSVFFSASFASRISGISCILFCQCAVRDWSASRSVHICSRSFDTHSIQLSAQCLPQ